MEISSEQIQNAVEILTNFYGFRHKKDPLVVESEKLTYLASLLATSVVESLKIPRPHTKSPWYCWIRNVNTEGGDLSCIYTDDEDSCIFCGDPLERK